MSPRPLWAGLGLLFLLVTSPLQAEPPKVVLTRLTDQLYVVEDFYFARENSVVFIGPAFVTVIGATWTPETARVLAAEVKKVTSKPIREVVNTNHDWDRVGGNAYFRLVGARIVSTVLTRDLLKAEGRPALERLRQGSDFPALDVVLPDTIYPGDFTLQEGRIRAFFLGPSHKPDDIFVYFVRERVLYAGCILKEHRGNEEGVNRVEYAKTLRKLKALNLPLGTVIAGHDSPIHGPELIDQFLALLEESP